MENLRFQLQYTTFTIPPSGYAFDVTGGCIIAVSYLPDSQGLYILGDSFLRNFVSSYDYEHNKIDIGVNINATDGVVIEKSLTPW